VKPKASEPVFIAILRSAEACCGSRPMNSLLTVIR
jgi:hypothetical protein